VSVIRSYKRDRKHQHRSAPFAPFFEEATMKVLLLISLLLTIAFAAQNFSLTPVTSAGPLQNLTIAPNGSLVDVLEFKCIKSRKAVPQQAPTETGPARAMIPQNKNYARNVRVNDPVGARDPNEDTIDGRSAALEKINQEANQPQNKPVDGFSFLLKLQNTSKKNVEILFWEYQFIDKTNVANVARRQFLCGVNIKPEKRMDVKAFSSLGPGAISVDALKNDNPFEEKVVINRVEYADGTIWQRKDWNFAEIGMAYRRAVATPWGSEMCRGL
jgi:hypothetical protein